MEQILIKGNSVELQELQTTKKISIESFKSTIRRMIGIRTPMLPRDVVFYASRENNNLYLVEREPGIVNIRFKPTISASQGEIKKFKLTFPYIYFALLFIGHAFERLYVYFAKEKLRSLGSELCYPPLPNLGAICDVCLGSDFRFSTRGTLEQKISSIITYYLDSEFNLDLSGNLQDKMPKEVKERKHNWKDYFSAWQELTQQGIDPLSLSWHKYDTLSNVTAQIIGE